MRSNLAKIAALFIAPAIAMGAATPNSGNSSVVLSIWNDGVDAADGTAYNNRSLTVDTGLNFSDLLVYNSSDAGTLTVDIDALVAAGSEYTTAADIFDTVISGNTYMQLTAFDGQMTGGEVPNDYALYTTYSNSSSPSGTNVQLTSSITNANTYYGFISSDGVDVTTEESADQPNAESSTWGDNFGGAWSQIDNAGAFDQRASGSASELTLNMAFVSTGGSGSNGAALDVNTFGGSMTAAFDFATGDLVITTAAVPVPAAVWLFGSAIAGLIGFSRRTSQVVTA